MTQLMEQTDLYSQQFATVAQRTGDRFGFFAETRRGAFERFATLGFPTTRHEEWRFTNLKDVAETPWALPDPAARADVSAAQVDDLALTGVPGPLLVFVDGFYRADLSRIGDLGAGVQVMSLAEAAASNADELESHLARYAGYEDDALTALNTAFIGDGAFIRIAAERSFAEPIRLLYIATDADRPRMTHGRNLIVAAAGSSGAIVEQYAALGGGEHLSNNVTEVVVGPNARLHHVFVDREGDATTNISTLRVHQERDSVFESHTALFGGALVRNNIHVELHGTGCDSLVNGLFMPRGTQHMDNHMRVVHAQPHCESRQFYHGILDDRSRGVFTGRIVVARDAQKTDAKQTNRNLLLADGARINTRPQLEIYADDVKCTHGATTGRLDDNALFYLRARGIPLADARGLLIYAFAAEALERISDEPVREALNRLVLERLPQAWTTAGSN